MASRRCEGGLIAGLVIAEILVEIRCADVFDLQLASFEECWL